MDEILIDLFDKWNDEDKCGFCWKFVRTFNDHYNAKGTTNIYKPVSDDKCCVHAFLEGYNISNFKEVDNAFGMTEIKYCDYKLHFKIVKQSDFEKTKADETGCVNNVYDDVVKPIIECLGCEFEQDLCSVLNGQTGIAFNESMKPIFNFGDENWSGVDYYVTVRLYLKNR